MRFDDQRAKPQRIINRDGSIPKDDPFAGKDDSGGDIWSGGHRNMLAAAVHPSTGQLWVVEMGPLGGDELNLVERGANYGWPAVSNGANYDKSRRFRMTGSRHFSNAIFNELLVIRIWRPLGAVSGSDCRPGRGQVRVGPKALKIANEISLVFALTVTASGAKTRPTADLSVKLALLRRRRKRSPQESQHNVNGADANFRTC